MIEIYQKLKIYVLRFRGRKKTYFVDTTCASASNDSTYWNLFLMLGRKYLPKSYQHQYQNSWNDLGPNEILCRQSERIKHKLTLGIWIISEQAFEEVMLKKKVAKVRDHVIC